MSSRRYDVVFSLGSSCACALYMQKADLRTFASPFDWLTHADFSTRLDLMLNDFEDFLNLEDLRGLPPTPGRETSKPFKDVENVRTRFHFLHDFPLGRSLEESFPEVKRKYDRRIRRFYDLIQSKKDVLLIWFTHDWRTDDDRIVSLWNRFCGKAGKRIDLLVIENDPRMPHGQSRFTLLAENIARYDLHTEKLKEDGRRTVRGDEEHCDPIFAQFSLRRSIWSAHGRRLRHILPRTICCLVPVRGWRKRIRAYFKYHLS